MILPKKQRSTKTSTQATRHCPNKQIHFPILQQVAVKNARPSLQYETSNMGFNWVSLSQDIWTQVFLSANVNKTGQFSQHRWPETRTVHSLSPHVWEFDPGSLTVRLKPTSPGCKLFLAKPLMQTLGEARCGNGAATPARIKTELSQTHQDHQADLVASKPECAQVQLDLLLPHCVLRQPNFPLSVPPSFNIPHAAGTSPMTACTARHQLQCLGSWYSSEMSCLKAFMKFLGR